VTTIVSSLPAPLPVAVSVKPTAPALPLDAPAEATAFTWLTYKATEDHLVLILQATVGGLPAAAPSASLAEPHPAMPDLAPGCLWQWPQGGVYQIQAIRRLMTRTLDPTPHWAVRLKRLWGKPLAMAEYGPQQPLHWRHTAWTTWLAQAPLVSLGLGQAHAQDILSWVLGHRLSGALPGVLDIAGTRHALGLAPMAPAWQTPTVDVGGLCWQHQHLNWVSQLLCQGLPEAWLPSAQEVLLRAWPTAGHVQTLAALYEAQALNHPVLGPWLRQALAALQPWPIGVGPSGHSASPNIAWHLDGWPLGWRWFWLLNHLEILPSEVIASRPWVITLPAWDPVWLPRLVERLTQRGARAVLVGPMPGAAEHAQLPGLWLVAHAAVEPGKLHLQTANFETRLPVSFAESAALRTHTSDSDPAPSPPNQAPPARPVLADTPDPTVLSPQVLAQEAGLAPLPPPSSDLHLALDDLFSSSPYRRSDLTLPAPEAPFAQEAASGHALAVSPSPALLEPSVLVEEAPVESLEDSDEDPLFHFDDDDAPLLAEATVTSDDDGFSFALDDASLEDLPEDPVATFPAEDTALDPAAPGWMPEEAPEAMEDAAAHASSATAPPAPGLAPPSTAPPANAPTPVIAPTASMLEGTRVRHADFGDGVVQKQVALENGHTVLHVLFDTAGKRLLDPALTPIERLTSTDG
jgi:hypothetical protein